MCAIRPIRQLASDLGLAKGTIERAYLLLESDGMVEARGRAGTFLIGRSSADRSGDRVDLTDLHEAADALAVTALQLGVSDDLASRALDDALSRLR